MLSSYSFLLRVSRIVFSEREASTWLDDIEVIFGPIQRKECVSGVLKAKSNFVEGKLRDADTS
jgi:hypothetical protein